jgi:hypothetical protein
MLGWNLNELSIAAWCNGDVNPSTTNPLLTHFFHFLWRLKVPYGLCRKLRNFYIRRNACNNHIQKDLLYFYYYSIIFWCLIIYKLCCWTPFRIVRYFRQGEFLFAIRKDPHGLSQCCQTWVNISKTYSNVNPLVSWNYIYLCTESLTSWKQLPAPLIY